MVLGISQKYPGLVVFFIFRPISWHSLATYRAGFVFSLLSALFSGIL